MNEGNIFFYKTLSSQATFCYKSIADRLDYMLLSEGW